MRGVIELGFINIHLYSIMIFLGMLTAAFLILKEAKKQNIKEDIIINLIFYSIIIGIIGARLYFVLFHLDYYLSHPSDILKIWEGGLAIHGGIIAALIFIGIYCNKMHIKVLKTLDILVVGLIIAQAIGRWGNFFNGEAYGSAVSLEYLRDLYLPQFIIDGMYINGSYYLPTFFFESVLCLIGFIILLFIRNNKSCKEGWLTSFYLIWYGIIRFFIEALRTDSLMLGPLKVAQLVSVVMIIIGVIILIKSRKGKLYNEEEKNV